MCIPYTGLNRMEMDGDQGRIARDQLPYATPPFSYEFIESRPTMKWRVRDAKDNAMGCAQTEEVAQLIVEHLNETWA